MDFRGIIENGVIRPIEPVDLPDGTEVEFRAVGSGAGEPGGEATSDELKRNDRRARADRTVEELAREQGVGPGRPLEELGEFWPEEDDVDEFLRQVREWRR